jgi:hypothetical protein
MTVRPIAGEIGRYFVSSESTGGEHLCDVLENACGCAAWTCNHRKHKAETGRPLLCKHLKAAREHAFDGYLEIMREAALSR